MPGLCEHMKDWITSPFTAVIKFQKDFVDEAKENLKLQKESYTRRQRELQERATQLKLDEMEGHFLCCVCGRSGQDHDDNHFASDTFSIVTLPNKASIRRAVRATEKAVAAERRRAELEDQRAWMKGNNYNSDTDDEELSTRADSGVNEAAGGANRGSAGSAPTRSGRADETPLHSTLGTSNADEEANRARAKAKERHRRERHRRRARAREAGEERAIDRWGPQYADDVDLSSDDEGRDNNGAVSGVAGDDDDDGSGHAARYRALLDPSTVGPNEIRTLMYNIRHAVLNKEARTKRSDDHARRDRGLTMLDDKEIDIFSRLFKRPLHGYLCDECHTSAKRRVDTLTEEIRALLFRADHPFLHKLQHRELYAWLSTGQISPTLAGTILQSQEEWEKLHRQRHTTEAGDAAADSNAQGLNRHDGTGGPADGVHALTTETASIDAATRRLRQAIARANADEENRVARGSVLETQMDILPDDVITKLREFVRCGVCTRRHARFFVRRSVLFTCQYCCARDRFYRDNTICINDEPMPTESALLLCELALYYETVHRQQHLRQLPQTELVEAPTELFSTSTHGDLFQLQLPDEDVRLVDVRPHFVPRGWQRRHPREAAARTMVSLFEGNTLVAGARAPLAARLPPVQAGEAADVAVTQVPLSLGATHAVQLFDDTEALGRAVTRSRLSQTVYSAVSTTQDALSRTRVPTDAPTATVPTLDALFCGVPAQPEVHSFPAAAAEEAERQRLAEEAARAQAAAEEAERQRLAEEEAAHAQAAAEEAERQRLAEEAARAQAAAEEAERQRLAEEAAHAQAAAEEAERQRLAEEAAHAQAAAEEAERQRLAEEAARAQAAAEEAERQRLAEEAARAQAAAESQYVDPPNNMPWNSAVPTGAYWWSPVDGHVDDRSPAKPSVEISFDVLSHPREEADHRFDLSREDPFRAMSGEPARGSHTENMFFGFGSGAPAGYALNANPEVAVSPIAIEPAHDPTEELLADEDATHQDLAAGDTTAEDVQRTVATPHVDRAATTVEEEETEETEEAEYPLTQYRLTGPPEWF